MTNNIPAEPRVACANCAGERAVGDMLFDERAEHYVCDRGCYEEWADENFEKVSEYYWRHNVE